MMIPRRDGVNLVPPISMDSDHSGYSNGFSSNLSGGATTCAYPTLDPGSLRGETA